MFVPKSLLAKGLIVGGVALVTEERCISSLDSWENLPESPVSWLPSLLAECSVSATILNGIWKLGCWPGELGESSSLISTVVPGWYRHTAWTNFLWGYIKSREKKGCSASEKLGHNLNSYCISYLLFRQSASHSIGSEQSGLSYRRLKRIDLRSCSYFSIIDEIIPSS